MKKITYFLVTLVFVLNSCSSESNDYRSNNETSISLIVKDENNNSVENAEVKLYTNHEDFENQTNEIQSGTTDIQGSIVFNNLETQIYYWQVNKTCKINNGIASVPNDYVYTANNTFNIQLSANEVGNIKFVNSTNFVVKATYFDDNGNEGTATVNPNSNYTATDIPASLYYISYENLTNNVPISSLTGQFTVTCGTTFESYIGL